MTTSQAPETQAEVLAAARLLLSRMGVDPAHLIATPTPRPPMPTFAAYVPVVSGAVTAGTRRAYGCYWARLVTEWGSAPV